MKKKLFKLSIILFLLWTIPVCTGALGYFESRYNEVNHGSNATYGTWGYFKDTGGYTNYYTAELGDEIGALYNNGISDFLVGVVILIPGMVADNAYGTMDIFSRPGFGYGQTIFFRIYDASEDQEGVCQPSETWSSW